MRITLLIVALASTVATQAFAMEKPAAHPKSTPDWDSCYMLGWYRGVHVELGELPDWMEACLSGQIPFDAAEAAGTKRAHGHARPHRERHS